MWYEVEFSSSMTITVEADSVADAKEAALEFAKWDSDAANKLQENVEVEDCSEIDEAQANYGDIVVEKEDRE